MSRRMPCQRNPVPLLVCSCKMIGKGAQYFGLILRFANRPPQLCHIRVRAKKLNFAQSQHAEGRPLSQHQRRNRDEPILVITESAGHEFVAGKTRLPAKVRPPKFVPRRAGEGRARR